MAGGLEQDRERPVEVTMDDHNSELRRIVWSQAFPFVRLFRTLRLALDYRRLLLGLMCVLLIYISGRIFDGIWRACGEAVTVRTTAGYPINEIEVYASATSYSQVAGWRTAAREDRERIAITALTQADLADDVDEARQMLADDSLRKLLYTDEHKENIEKAHALIDERLDAGLKALNDDDELTREERGARRQELIQAADNLRMMLRDRPARPMPTPAAQVQALATLNRIEAGPEPADEAEEALTSAVRRQMWLQEYRQIRPRGIFISLAQFEADCFAGAIQGALSGHWLVGQGASEQRPTMLGSIITAFHGPVWLVTHHPWYVVFFGVDLLFVLALFGGAICRSAAVQSARDESIGLCESLEFAKEHLGGMLLAPLLPVGIFVIIGIVMGVGGLIGALPFLGELFTGVFYPLALLGGFALAILLLATVFGFHLMWPTIAVEGSDGFDALSRACSYVGSRIWHVGFYSFVLLIYGALSYVLVRLVFVLVLKLSHTFTGWGMNLVSSARLEAMGKLNAMWSMPAWTDLSLLPTVGGAPLVGTFYAGPLSGSEAIGAWLIMVWVFLLLGLLVAFVVSYFFSGSTQMYFLLRRNVDATDYEEIYYEETEDELLAAEPPAAPSAGAAATDDVASPPREESAADAPDQSPPLGDDAPAPPQD